MVSPGGVENSPETDGHHPHLPLKVLEDVMCSFIRGIEAAEAMRKDQQ
jgi:hypothetical protein